MTITVQAKKKKPAKKTEEPTTPFQKTLYFFTHPPTWIVVLLWVFFIAIVTFVIIGVATGRTVEVKLTILGQSLEIKIMGVTVISATGIDMVIENGRLIAGGLPVRQYLEGQGFTVGYSLASDGTLAEVTAIK